MRHSRALSAFGHRNYRLFFVGQMISLIGTWMQQVAQGWLVLQVSGGNPLWLGIVAAAQFLPAMIFGLFGGVLADVLPKRQTLVATQAVQMVLAAILALLTAAGVVEIWMIVTLALLLGFASAVDMPVRQSFAIEMVGPREVGNAVSINSAQFNGARVIGPAIAGIAIGAFGIATAFAINAASFVAVIVGLAMMRDEELHRPRLLPRPRSVSAVIENLSEGLRFVRHTPVVLMAVLTVGLAATFGMNFTVIVPPLAQEVLASDAAGYGFLMTASGVGALSAAVVLVVLGTPRAIRIPLGAIVLGACSILLAFSTSYPISLLLMIPVGVGGITMAATANATIQLAVPDGLRGRVMSVYTTVFSASVPIGGIGVGALAAGLGVQLAVGIGGVLTLGVGIWSLVWYRRLVRGSIVAAAVAEGIPADDAPAAAALASQSTAPNTSAAFSPPNPNEVLSTRR